MAETTIRETVEQDQVGDQTITTTTSEAGPISARPANKLIQLTFLITSFIIALLGLRLILQLLGASQTSSFVDFIYSLTYPLVAPFYGIFGATVQYGTARLELETLFAMLVYALVGWGIASLIRLMK